MTEDEQIAVLQRGIRAQYGVTTTFSHVEAVDLARDRLTAWCGNVYVFTVLGHARATHAFAWTHSDRDGHERALVVLGLPPVTTAHEAAEVALVALYRGKRSS